MIHTETNIAAPSADNDTTLQVEGTHQGEMKTLRAPLQTAISPDFPPLTVEDVEALRAANRTDGDIKRIAANRATKGKKEKEKKRDLTVLLAEKRDWLLRRSGGKPLFSGKVAGTLLIEAGFYDPVRGFNSFGDKLGKHGHNLPSVVINGVRCYDITSIGKSAEEKEARQAYLDRASLDVLRELGATLKEDTCAVATAA